VQQTGCPKCGLLIRDDLGSQNCPACGQSRQVPATRPNFALVLGLPFLGFVTGFWAAFVSMGMGGDGSGWLSPVKVCWVAILAGPLSGIAWSLRRKPLGVGLMLSLLAVSLVSNFVLLHLTLKEGVGYAFKLFRLDPLFMLSWTAAWCGWQALVYASLLKTASDFVRKSK
jgi:hypothetical protein